MSYELHWMKLRRFATFLLLVCIRLRVHNSKSEFTELCPAEDIDNSELTGPHMPCPVEADTSRASIVVCFSHANDTELEHR